MVRQNKLRHHGGLRQRLRDLLAAGVEALRRIDLQRLRRAPHAAPKRSPTRHRRAGSTSCCSARPSP